MRLEAAGFAPDLDITTPGILTNVSNLVPTLKGMAAANTPVDTALPVLTGVESAFVAELLDGTKRFFAATPTRIWEASGATWTDRSRAGLYSGTTRQRFATFGNIVLAANRTQVIGQALQGGNFTDIAGSPLARILVPAAGFVMALNINGMTLGDAPDGWGCCAIRNQADWTPNVANQCVAGRLLDSPGAIRAGAALGDMVVAYKATSMYMGRYVGPPLVWQWQRVPGDVGCGSAEALVTVGTQHFFIGPNDFYMFDGTVPKPIGSPIREWFFANLSNANRDKIVGTADLARGLVYWFFPRIGLEGFLDTALIYNVHTGQWGLAEYPAAAAPVLYSSGQVTYNDLGTLYATYDALPDIPYDSPFWIADQSVPGLFQFGKLKSLTGTPGFSSWQTGVVGDLTRYTHFSRITPRYTSGQPALSATANHFNLLGDPPAFTGNATFSRGRFDFRKSAHWHRVDVTQNGPGVLAGFDIDLQEDSGE